MASNKKKSKVKTKMKAKITLKKTKVKSKPAKKPIVKKTKKIQSIKSKPKSSKAGRPVMKKAQAVNVKKERVTKMSISFSPLADYVLLLQKGESDRTPGGLYIPAIAQDRPAQGRILATGKGLLNKSGKIRPLDVKVGEMVVYSPYAGSKITIEGIEYVILKESEVLAVMRD